MVYWCKNPVARACFYEYSKQITSDVFGGIYCAFCGQRNPNRIYQEYRRTDQTSLGACNWETSFDCNFYCCTVGCGNSGCSATSFLRNWDSILEKKRANLRSISEPARLRQPPPRSTGAAHARGRAQSIREERRIAAPPVLFALLWVRLLPALYGPFCGPLRPFGGCPWGVNPPARECLPPAPPDTRRRG